MSEHLGGHFIEQCDHGTVVAQCRCPSPDRAVRIVACPPDCPTWLAEEVRRLRDVLLFADGLTVVHTGHPLANLYAADCEWAQTLANAGCHPRDVLAPGPDDALDYGEVSYPDVSPARTETP